MQEQRRSTFCAVRRGWRSSWRGTAACVARTRCGKAARRPLRRAGLSRPARRGLAVHQRGRRSPSAVPSCCRAGRPTSAAERAGGTSAMPAAARLVFVNGHFRRSCSSAQRTLPEGVTVGSLAAALAHAPPALVEPHLARYAPTTSDHAFTALNTAFLQDGASSTSRRQPSSTSRSTCIFVYRPGGEPTVVASAQPDRGRRATARLTLVESYSALGDDVYFTNAVTEIVARRERGRRSLQGSSRRARERSTSPPRRCTRPAAASSVALITSLGGAWSATRSASRFDGEGGEVHPQRPVPGRRPAARRQPHRHRPRQAALRQPRAVQGHPRRQGPRRLQRQDLRPPGRPEDRRQADQPDAAAVRRRDHQHQAAAGDLRRRRQMHARRHRRPARRRSDLLPAFARHRPGGGPQPADLCLRQRHRRPDQGRAAARASWRDLLLAQQLPPTEHAEEAS